MKAYRDKILSHKIQLWVRRGGPNYQEGLAAIREAGVALGIPTHVHGPETHMTAIVPMALMYVDPSFKYTSSAATGDGKASRPMICPRYGPSICPRCMPAHTGDGPQVRGPPPSLVADSGVPFTNATRALVFGLQHRAVQACAGCTADHRVPVITLRVPGYACRTCSTLTTAASGPRPPSLA